MAKLNEARTEAELRELALALASRALIVLSRTSQEALGIYMDWLVTDDFLTVEEAMDLLDTVLAEDET